MIEMDESNMNELVMHSRYQISQGSGCMNF